MSSTYDDQSSKGSQVSYRKEIRSAVIYSSTKVLVQMASFSLCIELLTYENMYLGSWGEMHWTVTLIVGTAEVRSVSAAPTSGQGQWWRTVVTGAWTCVTGCDWKRVLMGNSLCVHVHVCIDLHILHVLPIQGICCVTSLLCPWPISLPSISSP